MDVTLYVALITAIGSVLLLDFGRNFLTNRTWKVSFLSSCGFIAGCVIVVFAETETAWLCVGGILIVTCGLALLYTSIQKIGYLPGMNWSYKFCFDPEAQDKSKDSIAYINDSQQLINKLENVEGVNADIKKVSMYKCPLWKWQFTTLFFHHKFVIFETKKWHWSIEKTRKAIIILRSKDESNDNFKKFKQDDRWRNVKQMETARGKKSVSDSIDWLCEKHEDLNPYNAVNANCKDLANGVYQEVALSWCYEIEFSTDKKDPIRFKDSELMTKLVSHVDVKEDILNVSLYEDLTASKWVCKFQTETGLWSIEKRTTEMIITKNENKSDTEGWDDGKVSVHDLMEWLYNKKKLKRLRSYALLKPNTFAKNVFVYVSGSAKDKQL